MLRKIIRLGTETFVVSLPAAWMRQHKLKKGDELEVEEVGPRLIVYPKSESKQSKVVVDVSGTGPITKRILGALYKAGYDEFEVRFEGQKELETIRQTIRDSFVGFEIVSATKQTLTAKNLSEPKYEEFDTLIRRVFLLLLEMGNECFKAFATGSFGMLQTTAKMDEDVNRHVNFCRRALNRIGHRVVGRVAPTYYLVEQLERTGDCYKYLCAYLLRSTFVPSSTLKDLLADTNSIVRRFYELYYKFSLHDLAEFWRERERIGKSATDALEVAGKKELHAILFISEIIDNIANANGALLTARL
ncbi:MAG: phosphate uptake regulator PhoU [Nanoarchaeota archaeon]